MFEHSQWAAPRLVLAVAVAAAVALAAPAPTPAVAADRPFDEIIVFGHSAADNGNGFILTDGVACAPPYFGGRFSNGPLWVEWLAKRLGFGRPTETRFYPFPSLAGGTNYAVGGAETGDGYTFSGLVPNVGVQIEMFFADGRTLDGDELIVIQAGDNDSSAPIAARNMGEHIATLAAAGGKWFLIPNVARLSQDPGAPVAGPALDKFTAEFNQLLAGELDALEMAFPAITICRFDYLGLQDAMLDVPAAYGLTNVTDPACPGAGFGFPEPGAEGTIVPNPDEYMYWDFFHFTRVVHKIAGDAAADLVLAGR